MPTYYNNPISALGVPSTCKYLARPWEVQSVLQWPQHPLHQNLGAVRTLMGRKDNIVREEKDKEEENQRIKKALAESNYYPKRAVFGSVCYEAVHFLIRLFLSSQFPNGDTITDFYRMDSMRGVYLKLFTKYWKLFTKTAHRSLLIT